MLILVRKVRMQNNRIVDQNDEEFSAEHLTLGSRSDRDLQLFGDGVGTEHCVLQPQQNGQLLVQCQPPHKVLSASETGEGLRQLSATADQWLRIGPHQFARVEAPPGFDAAIELRVDIDATESLKQKLQQELTLKLPRIRRHSYLLALLTLAATLLLPLWGFYDDGAQALLDKSGAPSDRFWLSGPLAAPHHLPGLANDCNSCHLKPFQQVPDQACAQCHNTTPAHFGDAHPAATRLDQDCAACHKEHNEPETLIVENTALCVDCHRSEQARSLDSHFAVSGHPVAKAPTQLRAASAFTEAAHPEFLLALLKREPSGWQIQRERAATARESSNLKFPHDVHTSSNKVWRKEKNGQQRALHCGDCHQLADDGEHFQPITMETHCADCHSLSFDDAAPYRSLPHAQADVVETYLAEFYVKQLAEQLRLAAAPPPRWVPARDLDTLCPSRDPLQCGLAWADREISQLFQTSGCVDCHEVDQHDGRWQVREVRLTQNWMPEARFDHRPHLSATVDGEGCLRCHQADRSSHSRDVLMPSLADCTACHGEKQSQAVLLQCIDCHSFHRTGMPAMLKAETLP